MKYRTNDSADAVPARRGQRTFLPVLIAVPLALAAGYAARPQAQTAPPAAAHEESGQPVTVATRPTEAIALPSAPLDRIEPRNQATEPAPIASPRPAPLPAPPPAALERPAELQQWLLALPSADIARLSGTAEMDAYVGRIVGELQGTGDPEAGRNLEQFLTQINTAIVRAKSER